jgi:hypothetical protein
MSSKENDKIIENIGDSLSIQLVSNCCGAPVSENIDVCSACLEHCGGVDEHDNEYEFIINEWIKIK